ncbi:MAG: trypsin-like peptidase domain-containing protein, partial [Myxococcales bacterium]|nr:trypsin-like peptidase domain-containing protein [Myxococcales bacterium]
MVHAKDPASFAELQARLRLHRRNPRGDGATESLKGLAAPDLEPEAFSQMLQRAKAIYGPDSREEVTSDDAVESRVVAGGVCVFVQSANLAVDPNGGVRASAPTFAQHWRLCPGERFAGQPCLGFGSGFLVAPDVVVTAGHCVDEAQVPLADVRLLFGFEWENGGARMRWSEEEVHRIADVQYVVDEASGADWGVVRLARPVVGIAPLTVTTRAMKKGDAVYVIGHPVGLPKKIARQAWVTRDHAASWFETNLDTFGGNSGSPVFHASSHEVCGILVRGARDFVKRPEGCYVATTFPLEGGGEAVTRVSEWAGAVKQIKTQGIADVASISAPVPRTGTADGPWPRREATRSIDRARLKRFLEEHFTAKEMQSWLAD